MAFSVGVFSMGESDDLLGDFYRSMPSIEDHYKNDIVKLGRLMEAGLTLKFSPASPELRSNPEYEMLTRAVDDSMADPKGVAIIYEQLAKLAMATVIDPEDDSARARQLRYLRWRVTGMKDATSPFRNTRDQHSRPATETQKCASCGTAPGTKWCAGCALPADDGKPFATVYCSTDCQKKDWPAHRPACQEAQRLIRGVGIFDEVFRHWAAVSYPGEYTVTSITVDQGVAVARLRSSSNKTWVRFPAELAPSPDVATAVLMHTLCNQPLIDARPFLEMFIRPACRSLHKVVFGPRNLARPVRMIHDSFEEFSALSFHEVLRATLPSGAQYAVDTTGLQMGWKQSILPWKVYEQTRILRVESQTLVPPQPLGSGVLGQVQLAGSQPQRHALAEAVAHTVQKLLDLKVAGSPVDQLLRLKQPDFTTCRGEIVAATKRGLDSLSRDIARGAQPTLIKPPSVDRALAISATALACSLMDMLFLTPRERAGVEAGSTSLLQVRRRWHAVIGLGDLPGLDEKSA